MVCIQVLTSQTDRDRSWLYCWMLLVSSASWTSLLYQSTVQLNLTSTQQPEWMNWIPIYYFNFLPNTAEPTTMNQLSKYNKHSSCSLICGLTVKENQYLGCYNYCNSLLEEKANHSVELHFTIWHLSRHPDLQRCAVTLNITNWIAALQRRADHWSAQCQCNLSSKICKQGAVRHTITSPQSAKRLKNCGATNTWQLCSCTCGCYGKPTHYRNCRQTAQPYTTEIISYITEQMKIYTGLLGPHKNIASENWLILLTGR